MQYHNVDGGGFVSVDERLKSIKKGMNIGFVVEEIHGASAGKERKERAG